MSKIIATERACYDAFTGRVIAKHPSGPPEDGNKVIDVLGHALLDEMEARGEGSWAERPVELVEEAAAVLATAARICGEAEDLDAPIAHDATLDRFGIVDSGTAEGRRAAEEQVVLSRLLDTMDGGATTLH
jgi:hypothetical protein